MKYRLLLITILIAHLVQAQDTVKVMSYNILNYFADDADSSARNPFFRTTVKAANPDILTTLEVQDEASSSGFLNNVMKAASTDYVRAPFIHGYDTNSSLYFRSSKFTCTTNIPIKTNLRDVNHYLLVHKNTGDTLHIFAVHLKADYGTPEEQQRLTEVNDIRNVTNKFAPGTAFIVCGDFNFYGSTETGYARLLQADAGKHGEFYDPIPFSGTWNNHSYAIHHTQSPRVRNFGGGSTGGMDDRFDLILFSQSINDGGKVRYVEGSTTAFGNDGHHYNDSINHLPNLSEPVDVIEALHYGSDHLPVTARFVFDSEPATYISTIDYSSTLKVFPNPVIGNLFIEWQSTTSAALQLVDLTGRVQFTLQSYSPAIIPMDKLPAGIYFMKIMLGNYAVTYKIVH